MIIHGRVLDQDGFELGAVQIVERGRKGRPVQPDAYGRFSLSVRPDARTVRLTIERDGELALDQTLDVADIEGELILELPPRGRPFGDAASIALGSMGERSPARQLVDRLTERATSLGIDDRSIEAAGRLVLELDELSLDAMPALSGDEGALGRLRSAFEPEIPFDFDFGMDQLKPYPGDYGIDPCALIPRSPWSLVQVGMALDGGRGNLWAGRAVSAILRRTEPATRLHRALSGLEAGQVTEDVLRDAISFAAQVGVRGPSFGPVWETLGGERDVEGFGRTSGATPGRMSGAGLDAWPATSVRSASFGFPPPPGGGFPPPPGGFEIPRRPGLGTLLDPCNLEWLECAHTFVTTPPARTPNPPAVGKVEPSDIAAGQPTQLTLSPPAGGAFPAQQEPGWAIVLDGIGLSVSSWSTSEIVVDVPALAPACRRLIWLVDQHESAEFFNLQTEACGRFFGGRRPFIKPVIPYAIGQISVVGNPAVRHFTANNVAPKLLAEGCTAVQIDWQVDPLLCLNSTATLALEVKDDTGAVLWTGSQGSGVLSVTQQQDRIYTLTATNTLHGVQTGNTSATLEVERYQRLVSLTKTAPNGPVKAGATVTIEATLSCPADDPVQVVVTSSRTDRCPGLTINIPVGQTKASAQVTAGSNCGNVTLSGSPTGVSQSPVQTAFLVHDPKLDALVGSSLEQCDGGNVTVRVKCAASVSSVVLNGSGGSIPATGAPQVTASVPSDPASGTLQAVTSFGPLAAGSYAVQVFADGVSINAGNVAVALGPVTASIGATPSAIQVCAVTPVTITASARRATELSITTTSGTVIGTPVTGTNPCGSLTATATVSISAKTTFRAVAKRQGAANVTADATVAETTAVATASKCFVQNAESGTTVLYIYVVSLKPGMVASTTTKLGQISPGQQIAYTPVQCEVFELWGLLTDDPSLIGTTGFRWKSGVILGHPTATAVTFPA